MGHLQRREVTVAWPLVQTGTPPHPRMFTHHQLQQEQELFVIREKETFSIQNTGRLEIREFTEESPEPGANPAVSDLFLSRP